MFPESRSSRLRSFQRFHCRTPFPRVLHTVHADAAHLHSLRKPPCRYPSNRLLSFPSLHLSQRSDSLSASSTYLRLLLCTLDTAPLRELLRGAPSIILLPPSTPPKRAWKRNTSAASSVSVYTTFLSHL